MLTNIKEFLENGRTKYQSLERKWQFGIIAGVVAISFVVISSVIPLAHVAQELSEGLMSSTGRVGGYVNKNAGIYGDDAGSVASYEAEEQVFAESKRRDVAVNKSVAYAPQASSVAVDNSSRISGGASSTLAQAGDYFMPQIIKTANVSMTVDDVEVGMAALESLTIANFGIITNQNLTVAQQNRGSRYGNLVVRVPQDRLTIYLKDVKRIGKVTNQSQTGQDVSGEMVDLKSRVKNLKSEEKALQKIMTRTGKIASILEVSRELARVRGQIEQGQGRLNHLKQQVSYSTVNISLSEKYIVPASGKPTFLTIMSNTVSDAVEGIYKVAVNALQLFIWFGIFFLPILMVMVLMTRLAWTVVCRAWNAIPKAAPKKVSTSKAKSKKKIEETE